MPRVERELVIAAPTERAFDFVVDPANALRWMHNFTQFRLAEGDVARVGSRVEAVGTVLGFPVATTLEITELNRPSRLVSRTTGRIASQSAWEFEPVPTGTRVRFRGEYDVPGALLRFIGGAVVQRELDTNAEKSLANLKLALEGEST